jgi:dihydrolipoamide dehydrogenase
MSELKFDAVVIGAGPGGYVCAIRLAQLGKKTANIEREAIGGVCLNVGCIPSKALIHAANVFSQIKNEAPEMGISTGSVSCDLKKMQEWKSGVVKKLTGGVAQLLKANGVQTFMGSAVFKDKNTLEVTGKDGKQSIRADQVVIATGSRVSPIPTLPFNGKNIFSSTEALELTTLPKRFLVVGGGFIGLEIGTVYAKLGSQVTILEAMDQLLPTVEKELVTVVEKNLKKLGVTVLVQSKALGLKEKDPASAKTLHLDIESLGKSAQTLEADVILVAVGRKPNSDNLGLDKLGVKMDPRGNLTVDQQGRTSVPSIFAIGDVTGAPQLAHRAMMDGQLVAAALSGDRAFKDYKTVPWAVFCDPEIGTAGLTEKEAEEQGIKYRVGRFPFAANGRALSTNEAEGFVKVLIDEEKDTLLGVHIVGPEASNLVAEAALAIEMGATAEDVIRTIHTHPTLPEALPEAIEQAFSKAIHIYKPAGPRR